MGETPSPRSHPGIIAAGVATAAILAVAAGLYFTLTSDGGDDDRPPIVVYNGSLILQGGDESDTPVVKSHWRDWRQDLTSSHWKPDFSTGANVDHYHVTVTPANRTCQEMDGGAVAIEYTRTDGGTPSPVTVTLDIHPKHGFGKKEPKFDPGGLQMTPTSVISGPSGVPTFPAKLTFEATGYISKLTVMSISPSNSCTFGAKDTPRIRIDQVKPPPSSFKAK